MLSIKQGSSEYNFKSLVWPDLESNPSLQHLEADALTTRPSELLNCYSGLNSMECNRSWEDSSPLRIFGLGLVRAGLSCSDSDEDW